MFEGENWTEKRYAVAGDILDGYLYDLFMNMLEERGVNKDFAEKLSDYCSGYEHSLYISLLEDLQKFDKWVFVVVVAVVVGGSDPELILRTSF